MDSIVILGSTGSIGTQSVSCARHLNIKVEGISVNSNISLCEKQIRALSPSFCAVANESAAAELKLRVADTSTEIFGGENAVCDMLASCKSKTVINSIIGFAGLTPTLFALENKKNIAIANKETLVSAGETVMKTARENGCTVIPIDSEHCALHQCLCEPEKRASEVKRLLITASGGPFFGYDEKQLDNVTPEAALCHPNWSMGRKITIDSATMVNKGLEIIEATWLFGLPISKVDYIVHRESVVHSMVEYIDGSVLAQLSSPDMRLCIQYALTYPERQVGQTAPLDLCALSKLTFFNGDDKNFPAVVLAKRAAKAGGISPCVFNSANEACVDLFLNKKIKFKEIYTLISDAMAKIENSKGETFLKDIFEADRKAREFVYSTAR